MPEVVMNDPVAAATGQRVLLQLIQARWFSVETGLSELRGISQKDYEWLRRQIALALEA